MRLQWDPDHDPHGTPQERRALQLGLSGQTLRHFGTDWIVRIEDVSAFVAEQREHAKRLGWPGLQLPVESVFPVEDPVLRQRLRLDP